MKITILKRITGLLIILGLVSVLITSCEREIIGDELDGFKTDIVVDELDGFRELTVDVTDQIVYSLPDHMENKKESEIQSYIKNLSESELNELVISESDLQIDSRSGCFYVDCFFVGGRCQYANLLICQGQRVWFCSPDCTG